MFLHIVYGTHNRKNRVVSNEDINISIQKNFDLPAVPDMRIIFEKENLSFRMRISKIHFITNDDNGKIHLSVEGLDRKNRKVKVYTDRSDKKFIKPSEEGGDLFLHSDMADAFRDFELKEI